MTVTDVERERERASIQVICAKSGERNGLESN